MKHIYFITHPEVIVDPETPVPEWSLSERGRERMQLMLRQPWVNGLTAIYCSTEQKAIDGATVLAKHLQLPIHKIAELGENDRSATGFLAPKEFEATADQFFANPHVSVRGWETAEAAQQRIAAALNSVIANDTSPGSIAIVSHGAVGALLLCKLARYAISRTHDQPGAGGGHYYAFEALSGKLLYEWRAIENLVDSA